VLLRLVLIMRRLRSPLVALIVVPTTAALAGRSSRRSRAGL
jgi:Mg2+/citrate symporter